MEIMAKTWEPSTFLSENSAAQAQQIIMNCWHCAYARIYDACCFEANSENSGLEEWNKGSDLLNLLCAGQCWCRFHDLTLE